MLIPQTQGRLNYSKESRPMNYIGKNCTYLEFLRGMDLRRWNRNPKDPGADLKDGYRIS